MKASQRARFQGSEHRHTCGGGAWRPHHASCCPPALHPLPVLGAGVAVLLFMLGLSGLATSSDKLSKGSSGVTLLSVINAVGPRRTLVNNRRHSSLVIQKF